MIASSSTFCPHPARVARDLFYQLHAVQCVQHDKEALVYSNHPREAAASSYLAIIFGRIASGVPWFLRSTVMPRISAGAGVGRGQSFSIKLHNETQISSHLGMSVVKFSSHAQNPLTGDQRKTP